MLIIALPRSYVCKAKGTEAGFGSLGNLPVVEKRAASCSLRATCKVHVAAHSSHYWEIAQSAESRLSAVGVVITGTAHRLDVVVVLVAAL